jgi:hypothetical protein
MLIRCVTVGESARDFTDIFAAYGTLILPQRGEAYGFRAFVKSSGRLPVHAFCQVLESQEFDIRNACR